MKQLVRACAPLFGVLVLLAGTVPAHAQIAEVSAFPLYPGNAYRNNVAYDPVNQVYLVIVRRPPVSGQFFDKNNVPIGPEFVISQEPGDPFAAWASITFGGPPNDPTFLVTYTIADLALNPKFGRLVRYVPGGPPNVSPASFITDATSEWLFSEKATNRWSGSQFVVGTRVMLPGTTLPTPQVNLFDMNGVVSAPVILGDGGDYYGSPSISCASIGVCLAVGFKAGINTGFSGGSYGRMFEGATLIPLGGLFALSGFGPNEDQSAVFLEHAGVFLTQWYRGGGDGYIDTRLVSPNGVLGPLDLSKGIGPGAGTNTMAYNRATQTTLLLNKGPGASLTALELGDDGYPIRPTNVLTITNWDGAVLDYLPSMAANEVDGQWFITFELAGGGFGRRIQGQPITPSTGPPSILTNSPLPTATEAQPYSQFLIANGSSSPYTWTQVGGSLPPGLGLSGPTLAGVPTTPGTYNFRLRVTGGDGQFSEKDFTLTVNAIIVVPPGPGGTFITPGPQFNLWPGNAYRNNLAYDPINQVYLVIVKRPPVTGRFLDKNGVQIGPDFLIADEPNDPFTAWVSIAFGGPPNDPTFLVTYSIADLNQNPKYGRLVRYVPGGSPAVSAASHIVDITSEWLYSEKATSVWNGQQFVVGSRVKLPGAALPTPQINLFSMNGTVSPPQILGDGFDYYGSPAVSCAANGVCVSVGFMAGIQTGFSGGTYARRFDGTTLTPIGNLFHLAAGLPNEDQAVVYQTHTGRFLAQWFRGGGPGFIDTRLIGTDGTMSALNLNRGIGPGAGTNTMAYNAGTRTTLLINKGSLAELTAIELGDDGYPLNPGNVVLITPWDGAVLDYLPSVAANPNDGQWLITAELAAVGIAKFVNGTMALVGNPVQNPGFDNGMASWSAFGSPNPGDIVAGVNGGVLEFHRQNGSTSAGILQPLGSAVAAGVPISAQFDLGNSSNHRKRLTVIFHDADFSDLQFCSFWLAPGAPLRTYTMRMHTTELWSNATLSFYAATEGSGGGNYRVDNVSVSFSATHATERTECVDPAAPAPVGSGEGPDVVVNGDFSNFLLGWNLFGTINAQVSSEIFQFVRPAGSPAGALVQYTGVPLAGGTILTANFSLGNSSGVRKRVTAILHDPAFNDLVACSFWLQPGQPLSSFTMRGFTTDFWSNASISFYLGSVDTFEWAQIDNVSLRATPGATALGIECFGTPAAPGSIDSVIDARTAQAVTTRAGMGAAAPAASRRGADVPRLPVMLDAERASGGVTDWTAAGSFAPIDSGDGRSLVWASTVSGGDVDRLTWNTAVDLRHASAAQLRFSSWRDGDAAAADVQVSTDGVTWTSLGDPPNGGSWTLAQMDLSRFIGEIVRIRFVHSAPASSQGATWFLTGVAIELGAPVGRPIPRP